MNLRILLVSLMCLFYAQTSPALSERHLIIIHSGEVETNASLSESGRSQVKQMAERLLNHGFDNRNIRAVYVSTLKDALETGEVLADIGLYASDKIKMEARLNPSSSEAHQDVFNLYDEIESHDAKGHVIFVTHPEVSTNLILALTDDKVTSKPAPLYLLPISKRTALTIN